MVMVNVHLLTYCIGMGQKRDWKVGKLKRETGRNLNFAPKFMQQAATSYLLHTLQAN